MLFVEPWENLDKSALLEAMLKRNRPILIYFSVRDLCRNTPKRGSGEYSVKNEKKHCRESHLLLTNRQEISAYFAVLCCFFRVGHEQVLYCGCLPQWRQEKTGSQLFLKSDDRTKWREVLCKGADKIFKRLVDPRICSLHFKETDIAIGISSRKKIFLQAAVPTKAENTTSARSKRLDYRKRHCAEQPKAIRGQSTETSPDKLLGKRIQDQYLSFVTQYCPTELNLKQIIMQKWHSIQQQPLLSEIFKDPPIFSYKRGRSLKDIIVQANL